MLPVFRTSNRFYPVFANPLLNNEWMGRFFDDEERTSAPSVNVKETEKGFELAVAAPGLEKKDFRISVEKDQLTISAQKENQSEEKTNRFLRREFSYEKFTRSFTLPENIDAENITAQYENGVLNVLLPKRGDSAPRTKEISIG